MNNKTLILAFLIVFLSGVFFAAAPVSAMPIGTLLYRTSRFGEMYGQNTRELFQLLDVSSEGKFQTMKINCGHVGMYVGKINGEDMVLEAISNGVQLLPAKYFIDTREGEKLVGARIPKSNNINAGVIVKIAQSLVADNLSYDWGFSNQKGPASGQWICVGLTEKVYESLSPSLKVADIKQKNVLQTLEYNPANYAIDITPDGFDNDNVINKETGDCLAGNKEYSKITQRYFEPAYLLGKITPEGRYFFLPYTQFMQPTLKNVEVDIPLESDFEAEKIRGKMHLIKVAKIGAINTAKQSTEKISTVAVAVALKIKTTTTQTWQKVSDTAVQVASAMNTFAQESLISIRATRQDFFDLIHNIRETNVASFYERDADIGKVLATVEGVVKTENGDYTMQFRELSVPVVVLADDDATEEKPISEKSVDKKEKAVLAEKKEPDVRAPTPIFVSKPKEEVLLDPSAKETPNELDLENINPVPPVSSPKPAIIPYSVGGSLNSSSPGEAVVNGPTEPENYKATTTPATTTLEIKPAPEIKLFSLFDRQTSSTIYSLSQKVSLNFEIENVASVEKYFLGEKDESEKNWITVLPSDYDLSFGDGEKTVYLFVSNSSSTISKTAGIFLDTAAPTSGFKNLPEKYVGTGFEVSWQGSDDFNGSVGSGIEYFEIDYALSTSSAETIFSWQPWLEKTTATSSIFDVTVFPNYYVYFGIRAKDRAGILSAWKQARPIKILPPHTALISEFAVAGPGGSYDEFVELYNPSEEDFSLTGWSLQSHGDGSIKWINRTGAIGLPEAMIKAHGYYLLAAKDYSLGASPDYRHSANWSLADSGGSLRLVDESGNEIDKISYGKSAAAGSDLFVANFKTSVAERKAAATSTSALMVSPGGHSLLGNGYDADSDNDFVINSKANPQNYSSPAEPVDLAKIIPSKVIDLAVAADFTTTSSIKIIWSAPESANLSADAKYELRYKIKNGACDLAATWDSAMSAPIELLPIPSLLAGTREEVVVSDLNSLTSYCFALKTFNGHNYSEPSNELDVVTKGKPTPQLLIDYGRDNQGAYGQPTFPIQLTKNNIAAVGVYSYYGYSFPMTIDLYDSLDNLVHSEVFPEGCGDQCWNAQNIYTFSEPIPVTPGETYHFSFSGDVEHLDHFGLTTYYLDIFP